MQTVTLDDSTQTLTLTIADPPPASLAQDPVIQNILNTITPILPILNLSSVEFEHFDVLLNGIFSHRLKIILVDARTATMKFTQLDPFQIFDFALGGVWSEQEFNYIATLKTPFISCHQVHHTQLTTWVKK